MAGASIYCTVKGHCWGPEYDHCTEGVHEQELWTQGSGGSASKRGLGPYSSFSQRYNITSDLPESLLIRGNFLQDVPTLLRPTVPWRRDGA